MSSRRMPMSAWQLLLVALALSCSIIGPPAMASTPFVRHRVLVRFAPDTGPQNARSLIASAGCRDDGEIPRTGIHVLQIPATADEEALTRALARHPGVEFAELDTLHAPATTTPNDPYYPSQWHLPAISAPTAWDSTVGAGNVTIAILDSGCDPTHPDLAPLYVPGWNFYDNNADTSDVFGHGTPVAGCAVAATNNGCGIASVAWGCRIMPLRITNTTGYASTSAMAAALTWAADRGARVANLSFSVSNVTAVDVAAKYFMGKGGVVTVAAGNNGTVSTRADDPWVLTVSATSRTDAVSSWSNTGTNIDVSAPGESITTTARGGFYGSGVGTSFSAPIVAGVAALVISRNPQLTGEEAQDVVRKGVDDLGAKGWDAKYGCGRVNAAKAVALASVGLPMDTTSPSVAFDAPAGGVVSGTVIVRAAASDNVAVAAVRLYLEGRAVAERASAPYEFTWNTQMVCDGAHVLRAEAFDAAGNVGAAEVSVRVRNKAPQGTPGAAALASAESPATSPAE